MAQNEGTRAVWLVEELTPAAADGGERTARCCGSIHFADAAARLSTPHDRGGHHSYRKPEKTEAADVGHAVSGGNASGHLGGGWSPSPSASTQTRSEK